MIQLENVTKLYPGHTEPAVDNFSIAIPDGEIVIFLGPSGCGKTTTLKMINRLIEPTSGKIILNGEDVTKADANELRRRIGYVIQQIGLFPHMTIADNIAVVPRMLGWSKDKITRRVDELLSMVGLNPANYRARFPRQLSGGQQQRVGVARALAADPPVLLMDEPFGATDPITREHLQDELLRIQANIRKTIVFVTHDIDEALRLGDKIAILREQSKIAQYAAPDELLARPANEYVRNFIGAGVTLKRLQVIPLRGAVMEKWKTIPGQLLPDALRGVSENAVIVDEKQHPVEFFNAATHHIIPAGVVSIHSTLHSALDKMLMSPMGAVCVVDDSDQLSGVITINAVMDELRSTHSVRPHEYEAAE